MLNSSVKSIVSAGSAALLITALGTYAYGDPDSRSCRDLRSDIMAIRTAIGVLDGKVNQSNQTSAAIRTALGVVDGKVTQSNQTTAAIRTALGVVDGKVDQSNQSIAAVRTALGVMDGKIDQSNQSSAAIRTAIGLLDGKVTQSNADLAIIRSELQRVRDVLLTLAVGPINGGLQLQVEADQTSCASGAIQCASTVNPSDSNQNPVELKLLVQLDQVSVTNLDIADFSMISAFGPSGGPGITACSTQATGCGDPEFFINRGNGGYQLWVHPPAENWMGGTYSLLLRVTDTAGHVATKMVNVSIRTVNPPAPPPPGISDPPAMGMELTNTLDPVVAD